jgi:hypothetical protein
VSRLCPGEMPTASPARGGIGVPIVAKNARSQQATTARYVHLATDPVKAAAVAAEIAAAMDRSASNLKDAPSMVGTRPSSCSAAGASTMTVRVTMPSRRL